MCTTNVFETRRRCRDVPKRLRDWYVALNVISGSQSELPLLFRFVGHLPVA